MDGRARSRSTTAATTCGRRSWAPATPRPVVQWSKGEYPSASQLQDDLAVIGQHGPAVRADDHTNDTGTRHRAHVDGRVSSLRRRTDADLFEYVAPATGRVTFTADPVRQPQPRHPAASVLGGRSELAQDNPTAAIVTQDVGERLGASIQHDVVSGTTYYVQVGPTGVGPPPPATRRMAASASTPLAVSSPSNQICPPDDGFEPNDLRSQGTPVDRRARRCRGWCVRAMTTTSASGRRRVTAISVDALFSHAAGDIDIYRLQP